MRKHALQKEARRAHPYLVLKPSQVVVKVMLEVRVRLPLSETALTVHPTLMEGSVKLPIVHGILTPIKRVEFELFLKKNKNRTANCVRLFCSSLHLVGSNGSRVVNKRMNCTGLTNKKSQYTFGERGGDDECASAARPPPHRVWCTTKRFMSWYASCSPPPRAKMYPTFFHRLS